MPSTDLPAIIQKAELVRAMIENAVSGWARAHRYEHGVDLRRQVKAVVKATHALWRSEDPRELRLKRLDDGIEDLRSDMRLGQAVRAFRSWGEFDSIMQQINELGRQCGAMQRSQRQKKHSYGQNADRHAQSAARQDTEYPGRLAGAKS